MLSVSVSKWAAYALRYYLRYFQLVALIFQKCTIICVTFSIMSQRRYYTIFVFVCYSLFCFVVVWVDRHGQYMQVVVRNSYACEGRRGSYSTGMLDWDPSNCNSRKILYGHEWKNRWLHDKIFVGRIDKHSYCISSHTFYSRKLKSDWKSLCSMQRTKQETNFYQILCYLSNACCTINEFQ